MSTKLAISAADCHDAASFISRQLNHLHVLPQVLLLAEVVAELLPPLPYSAHAFATPTMHSLCADGWIICCHRYFFRQIVEGLGYCHRCHIAHRDLKLANFLLSTDEPMR
jgi:hypothetical protein